LERVPDAVRVVELAARPPVVVTKTVGLARCLRQERPAVVVAILDVVGPAVFART